jgi:hypothetical protein
MAVSKIQKMSSTSSGLMASLEYFLLFRVEIYSFKLHGKEKIPACEESHHKRSFS